MARVVTQVEVEMVVTYFDEGVHEGAPMTAQTIRSTADYIYWTSPEQASRYPEFVYGVYLRLADGTAEWVADCDHLTDAVERAHDIADGEVPVVDRAAEIRRLLDSHETMLTRCPECGTRFVAEASK